MGARVELQRYMVHPTRYPATWTAPLGYRAVCDDLVHGEPILGAVVPQTWSAAEVHDAWVFARIDAVQHDVEHHGRPAPIYV